MAFSKSNSFSKNRGKQSGSRQSFGRNKSSGRGGSFGRGRSSGGGGFNRGRGGGRGRGRGPSNLDISSFISRAKVVAEQDPIQEHVVERTFADFDLNFKLQQNIASRGYVTPTPIQDKALDSVLEGKDLLGIANTGTGKTGAFLIPAINKIINNPQENILIIAPTRELALQINEELRSFTQGLRIFSVMCIGGTNMHRQMRDLTRNFNVVIGTPGRLKDLIDRNVLSLHNFSTVVLDEVDRMLDMGFVHDMREILSHMPTDRQSLFFSATMTPRVKNLISEFSTDLIAVSAKTTESAATVDQDIVHFSSVEEKVDLLHDILIQEVVEKTIVFGRTKHGVQKLMFKLRDRGFRADSMHGNKSQPQRQRALKDFRDSRVDILIATDVAARGIDVQDVTHVINFDVPETYDDYIHRIGRTGRANKRGTALTFVQARGMHAKPSGDRLNPRRYPSR